MKNLEDVANLVGLSRRIIQEYESNGLASKPTTTNKYGHLLYGPDEVKRLWQLRFYKEVGYKKNDILAIEADENYDSQSNLEEIIKLLNKKREDLDNLINVAKMIKDWGIRFEDIKFGVSALEDMSFNDILRVLGSSINLLDTDKQQGEEFFVSILTEADEDEMIEAFLLIMKYCVQGEDYSSAVVQEQIKRIHDISAKEFSGSILFFEWNNLYMAPKSQTANEIDAAYGKGKAEYFYEALQFYCKAHVNNKVDQQLYSAIDNILKLGRQKFTTDSKEVQGEVSRIHDFFRGVNILTERGKLELLQGVSRLYGSKAYRDALDKGATRGAAWFISRAIQIYCENLEIQC